MRFETEWKPYRNVRNSSWTMVDGSWLGVLSELY